MRLKRVARGLLEGHQMRPSGQLKWAISEWSKGFRNKRYPVTKENGAMRVKKTPCSERREGKDQIDRNATTDREGRDWNTPLKGPHAHLAPAIDQGAIGACNVECGCCNPPYCGIRHWAQAKCFTETPKKRTYQEDHNTTTPT